MMKIGLTVLALAVAAPAFPLCAQALPDAPFGGAGALAPGDLARITGRDDTAMAVRAQNSGTVAHNSVIGQSQTGTISFDAAAFQNMAGLSLLSANTGNNVSINSSLNVNVSIRP